MRAARHVHDPEVGLSSTPDHHRDATAIRAQALLSVGTRGGWDVSYHRIGEPRSSRITGKWPADGGGLTADLRDLTALALKLNGDKARFLQAFVSGLDSSSEQKFVAFTEAVKGGSAGAEIWRSGVHEA
jgi:hypothetical protein